MRRKNVMLASKFNAKRLATWPTPHILQPKINGRRALAYFDGSGRVSLRSSEDHSISSLPTLIASLESLNLSNITLDGELYNKQLSLQRISAIVSPTTRIHPDEALIRYYCFDVINDQPQFLRIAALSALLQRANEQIVHVSSVISGNLNENLALFLGCGYEGIIIRHTNGIYQPLRSTYMMKLKLRTSGSFPIVDFYEELTQYGEPKNSLGSFELRAPNGQLFKVGTGFTRQQRDDFWQMDASYILLLKARILYQELSDRGVPIFPVFVAAEEPV